MLSPSTSEGANANARNNDDIRHLREKWIEAFNRRDVERVMSLYAEDAIEQPLNEKEALIGVAAIRAAWERALATGLVEMKARQTQVDYTEPLAVELATYTLKLSDGNNGTRSERGRVVATWRRGNSGKFKITISMWSPEKTEEEV